MVGEFSRTRFSKNPGVGNVHLYVIEYLCHVSGTGHFHIHFRWCTKTITPVVVVVVVVVVAVVVVVEFHGISTYGWLVLEDFH